MKKWALVLYFLSFFTLVEAQDFFVGSEKAYKPFAYIDEQGLANGFDNEAIKIVASYIKDANIHFVSVTWNAIFQGLESNKFQIIANQISKSKEREEKYLFSSKPYFYGTSALIVGTASNAKNFDDLKGAKIGVTVGSNHANNLEKFAKENTHLNLQIVFYKTSPSLIADLANGRIKAMINDPIAAQDYAKAQNVAIKSTEIYLEKTPIYFVFRKEDVHLKKIFDEALQKALNDGKLSELSLRYFGVDFSK